MRPPPSKWWKSNWIELKCDDADEDCVDCVWRATAALLVRQTSTLKWRFIQRLAGRLPVPSPAALRGSQVQ